MNSPRLSRTGLSCGSEHRPSRLLRSGCLAVFRQVLRFTCSPVAVLALVAVLGHGNAWADQIKANNTTALNLGGSYVSGTVPGSSDVLVIDSTLATARTAPLGASLSILGINSSSANRLTIGATPGAGLTLGGSGITVTNTAGVKIDSPIVLGTSQTWTNNQASGSIQIAGGIDLGGFTLDTSTANSGRLLLGGTIASGTIRNRNTSGFQTSGATVFASSVTITGSGAADIRSNTQMDALVTGSGGLSVNSSASTLTITNTNNSFSGNLGVLSGTIYLPSIANSGSDSAAGRGTTVLFGSTVNDSTLKPLARLIYTGSSVATNRAFTRDTRCSSAIDVATPGQVLTIDGNLSQNTSSVGTTTTTAWSFGGEGILRINGNILNGTVTGGTDAAHNLVKKSGTGTLILAGNNTYIGATDVTEGVLLVTNTTGSGSGSGPLTVTSATLGGNGTIAGVTTFGTGGRLMPGATTGQSMGKLSFGSSLSLTNASTTLEISGTGSPGIAHDQVVVTGTLTYSGTLAVNSVGGFQTAAVSGTYPLFTFGGQTGDFDGVTVDDQALVRTGVRWRTYTATKTIEFDQSTGLLKVFNTPPLEIITQPASVSISAGQSTLFSVLANNATNYQWRRHGVAIPGATGTSYTVTAATAADLGSYDVIVSNDRTTLSSTVAKLNFGTPPVVSVQPFSRSVGASQSVTFSVVAASATSFQWRRDGANLVGGTSASYTIPSAQVSDSGNYDVIVGNGSGMGTSALARLIVIAGLPSTSPINLFVAPGGVDTASGMADAPMQTLEKARDQVRALARPLATGGVTVWLRGGEYVVTSSIALSSTDSGSSSAPILYRAYPGEKVSFRSGKAIPAGSFTAVSSGDPEWNRLDSAARGRVYKASLAALGLSSTTFRIASQGHLLPQSRYPDGAGSLPMVRVAAGGDGTATVPARFQYKGDYPARWTSPEVIAAGARIEGSWNRDWILSNVEFLGVDTVNHEILMKYGDPNNVDLQLGSKFSRVVDGMKAGFGSEKWWILNLIEEITVPGEWAIDQRDKTLYVWLPDASPEGLASLVVTEFSAPLITLSGVTDVQIQGLDLSVGLGDGIQIANGARVSICGNRISDLGGNGIVISGSTTANHVIQSNDICDLTGIGIKVADVGNRSTLVAAGLQVRNNHIHDVDGDGLNLGISIGITAANNLIHHVGASGIGSGSGNEILLDKNEVHHAGRLTSDVGLFYCFPRYSSRNYVLRNNYFHDDDQNTSVYIDNYGAGITVDGNVFYKTVQVLAGNRGGLDNRVSNNLFIDTIGNAISMPLLPQNTRFNTDRYAPGLDPDAAYWTAGNVLELNQLKYNQAPWSTAYPEMVTFLDYNRNTRASVYNNAMVRSGSQGVSYSSLATFVDPANPYYIETHHNIWVGDKSTAGFVDPAALNFQLTPGSTIFTQIPGFPDIPFNQIGLQTDAWRTALPGAGVTGRYRNLDSGISMTGAITEDFTGSAVGSLPDGWESVAGTPSVQDASGNRYLRSRAAGESVGGVRLTLSRSLVLDQIATIQAKVRLESTGVAGQRLLSLLGPTGFPALELVCSGTGSINGIPGTTLVTGQWHTLRVMVNIGSWQYSVWFDGTKVVNESALAGSPDASGIASLKTEASLDDLAVDIAAYPVASALTVTANATSSSMVGLTLAGAYTYSQPEGQPEAGTTFRWLRANDLYVDGQPISNATALNYTTTAADAGKYVYLEVTPMAGSLYTGLPVASPRFFVMGGGSLDLSNTEQEVVISGSLSIAGATTWTTGNWSILPTYWSQIIMKGVVSGPGSLTVASQSGYPNRAVAFCKSNTFSGGFTLAPGGVVYLGDPSVNSTSNGSSASTSTGSGGVMTAGPLGTGSWTIQGGIIVPKGANAGAPNIAIQGDFQVGGDSFYGAYPNNRLTLSATMNLGGATRTITLAGRRNFSAAMVTGGYWGALSFVKSFGITPSFSNGTLRLAAGSAFAADEIAVVNFTGGDSGFDFVNNAGLTIGPKVFAVFGSGTNFIGAANTLPTVTVEAGGRLVLGSNGGNMDARRVNISALSGAGTVLTFDKIGGTGVLAINGGNLGTTTLFSGEIRDTDLTLSATSNGRVSVEKSGNSTQIFSGSNSYTGSTVVSGGKLKLGSATALPSATALVIGAAGTLDLGGYNATVQTLSNSGAIVNSGTSRVTLTVLNPSQVIAVDPLVPPSITSQPLGATVLSGSTATFSVTGTGYPAVAFRWQRKMVGTGTFADISGSLAFTGVTSPTLVVPSASLAMNGDEFRCVVGNSQGEQVSSSALLVVAQSAWHLANFSAAELTSGSQAGDTDDPDRDGIPNLVEYAFNLDPHKNSAGLLPKPVPINGGTSLRLEFDRIRSDLTYTVEVSTDLITWDNGIPSNPNLDVQVVGNHVTATYNVGSRPRSFMRVKVVRIP